MICACCRILDQQKEQCGKRQIMPDSVAAKTFPLWPTRDGSPPTKAAVVKAWKALARYLKEKGLGSAADWDEWDRVAGHSPRRTGAKLLARLGWELWMIQFFGRWAGEAVRGYVEEAWQDAASLWSLRGRTEE